MYPLFTTRTVIVSRTIPASREDVLKIIQDQEQALSVSPLVYSVVQDPKDPSWYTVKEKLPVLGGLFETSTTFRCQWEKVADGNNANVTAGLGTQLRSEMRVSTSHDDSATCIFTEKLVVTGFCLLMPYIASTMKNAHLSILDIIAAKVVATILMLSNVN